MVGNDRRKFPPFPLNTLELQKRASRFLRFSSEHTMKVSYPCLLAPEWTSTILLALGAVKLRAHHDAILLPSHLVPLQVAEELYQRGFLSYPRTETDRFDPSMDLKVRGGDGRR